jgi:hypothetical protein
MQFCRQLRRRSILNIELDKFLFILHVNNEYLRQMNIL